ncbi:MAG: dihydropteroate synthase [Bacteroidales bacterium]|nr:dihydropteroate synthase [Bacteroidales bacterium]
MVLAFNGKQLDISSPKVMGILNITPDSFFDPGHYSSIDLQLRRVEQMLDEGAEIIDIGAVSTRPGAEKIPASEEVARLIPSLIAVRQKFPECFLSVDTFQPVVVREAVAHGADMINDIFGGRFAGDMMETIAGLNVPYILMHMKGVPGTMQVDPQYQDVVAEVAYFFHQQTEKLRALGASQTMIDPGFGFGKTAAHNFELLDRLQEFKNLGFPIVVGFSRKSMIQKTLGVPVDDALNGTTVLNTIALQKGASILRVHDVKEAVEAVKLVAAVGG